MLLPHGRLWPRLALGILGVALLFLQAGCVTQMVATRMVKAPNLQGATGVNLKGSAMTSFDFLYQEVWRVPVADPAAELSLGMIEPGKQHITFEVQKRPDGSAGGISFEMMSDGKTEEIAPKGTLVLLHGIGSRKEDMLMWAMYFAQGGYRAVVVDLRGHGRSTGKWIGFGAWEARDLITVTDELARRGVIVGRLGVFGVSYGAAMALHWAARDPRVEAVVALEPFSEPQRAIVDFAHGVMPRISGFLGDKLLKEAVAEAPRQAGFRWDDARVNVVESVKHLHEPVLFFHGRNDNWVDIRNTKELLAVAPRGSTGVYSDDDHISLLARLDTVGPRATAWFDEKLGTGETRAAASSQ